MIWAGKSMQQTFLVRSMDANAVHDDIFYNYVTKFKQEFLFYVTIIIS